MQPLRQPSVLLATDQQISKQVAFRNALRLHPEDCNAIIVHDPQPLPLVEYFAERKCLALWQATSICRHPIRRHGVICVDSSSAMMQRFVPCRSIEKISDGTDRPDFERSTIARNRLARAEETVRKQFPMIGRMARYACGLQATGPRVLAAVGVKSACWSFGLRLANR